MRRSQKVGTKYDAALDRKLDNNQDAMVDELITPHSTRLNEILGPKHQIVASYAAHHDPQMPVRSKGPIVWNRAYEFQSHGPSFLDPVSDPSGLSDAR